MWPASPLIIQKKYIYVATFRHLKLIINNDVIAVNKTNINAVLEVMLGRSDD